VLKFFEDINECSYNNGNCESNSNCVNTLGSYTCQCVAGWTGNEGSCYGKMLQIPICCELAVWMVERQADYERG